MAIGDGSLECRLALVPHGIHIRPTFEEEVYHCGVAFSCRHDERRQANFVCHFQVVDGAPEECYDLSEVAAQARVKQGRGVIAVHLARVGTLPQQEPGNDEKALGGC